MSPTAVVRFAPSPTGHLHLGNGFSALYSFAAARALGGRFLLRVEDIDQGRCRPEHETAMLADLAWLKVPEAGVEEVRMEEQGERGRNLLLKLKDDEGRGLELRLASTLADRAAADLVALQTALGE